MSKVIYAVMALALSALVAGFFVDTSNAPLIGSIALSGAVMLLILVGWSRRIRKGLDLMEDGDVEASITELDDDERPALVSVPDDEPAVELPDADGVDAEDADFRPPTKSTRAVSDRTTVIPAVKPAPVKAPSKKAAAKSPPGAPAAKRASPAKKTLPAKKSAATSASSASSSSKVLVIPGRSRFHRAGCRFAKGDDLREVSETMARRRGYEPCNVCRASDA